MQRPCQDITPRTLTRQIKTDDVKLNYIWRHILGLRYATVHATSSWQQLQMAFLNCRFFFIHTLSHFLDANYVYTNIIFIKHAELKEMDEKWLGRSYYWSRLLSVIVLKNKKKIYFFSVNTKIFHLMYWKYHQFHSCYALVKKLIFSTHSMK